jgi:hypothetical protein
MFRVIHWAIIGNFVVQCCYASYMTMFVIGGSHGRPLFAAAAALPFETMATRRLYAAEFWIAFSGLAIYLALTEIGPRLARATRAAEAIPAGLRRSRGAEALLQLRQTGIALRVLAGRLGVVRACAVALRVLMQQARGEPWRMLPPAEGAHDAMSRQQAQGPILLYRALLPVVGRKDALTVVGTIVGEAGAVFLAQTVPPLPVVLWRGLPQPARETLLGGILSRFPNTEIATLETSAESASFRVSRCRLVELAALAGAPEIAPVFCAADGVFLERRMGEIVLDRPTTLAANGAPCQFRFAWRDGASMREEEPVRPAV